MNGLLMLQCVLSLSLAEGPRSAALWPEPAPATTAAAPTGEQTPIVEVTPPEATPAVEQAEAPADAQDEAANGTARARLLFEDVHPGRVTAGYIAGGVAALAAPLGTLAFLLNSPGWVPSDLGMNLLVLLGMPLVSAWVAGPLVATLAMGGWPVAGRVVTYALVGAALGLLSVGVPVLGIATLLGGPMLGAVYAVATSPADAFGTPVRAVRPAAPGPILTFTF